MRTGYLTSIVSGLVDLIASLEQYDLLSNGIREEIHTIVPGGSGGVDLLDDDAVVTAVFEVVNVFRRRRLEPLLSLHGLPHPRYPLGEATTSIGKAPPVPIWDTPHEAVVDLGGWSVLGYDVGFPIGIPSCELTCNADWIEYYARKGFHILTYRTVRSRATEGDPYDWVFIADNGQFLNDSAPTEVRRAADSVSRDWRTASTATPFVAPCPEPHVWAADIAEARRRLDRLQGQYLLIVSVTESLSGDRKTPEALADDFAAVAMKAESAGAQAIECDLSRATVSGATGGLVPCERSPSASIVILRAVRSALRSRTALLIKLSGDLSLEAIEQLVVPLASEGLVDGVSGISPVKVERVTDCNDGGTLWAKTPRVAGYALRDMSRVFVERLSRIREQRGLRFDIIAMGGVMIPEDVAAYLNLGASAVQTATAAVSDPDLGAKALADYRCSVAVAEEWDGFVVEVDYERGIFWARLIRIDAEGPDEEAQFELIEVRPEERSDIRPGSIFRWRVGIDAERGELVRRSSVSFRKLPALTKNDYLTGQALAVRVAESAGMVPDP